MPHRPGGAHEHDPNSSRTIGPTGRTHAPEGIEDEAADDTCQRVVMPPADDVDAGGGGEGVEGGGLLAQVALDVFGLGGVLGEGVGGDRGVPGGEAGGEADVVLRAVVSRAHLLLPLVDSRVPAFPRWGWNGGRGGPV